MDGRLDIFKAISRRMDWLGQRQEVIARNIANADTPKYVPHDLKEGPFARLLGRSLRPFGAFQTNPLHQAGTLGGERDFKAEEVRQRYETAPSGNAVVLEDQLVNLSETQNDYQTMSNLYRKQLQMFRTALGQGG